MVDKFGESTRVRQDCVLCFTNLRRVERQIVARRLNDVLFRSATGSSSRIMAGSTATFVSQKINKIRWKPTPNQIVPQPEVFVTGSWDNGVSFFS